MAAIRTSRICAYLGSSGLMPRRNCSKKPWSFMDVDSGSVGGSVEKKLRLAYSSIILYRNIAYFLPARCSPRVPVRKVMRGELRCSATLAFALLVGWHSALAQPYPAPGRSITIVVGYPAGGGVDVMARTLAHELARELGTTPIVE